jgi:hypothetical protein
MLWPDLVSTRFYSDLPSLDRFSQVVDPSVYRRAPPGWSVVITDVIGSTRAIEGGRYKDVNALGAASIVAVSNAIPELEIPFVFGGDGATLLIPPEGLARVRVALRGLVRIARRAFDLELRAGIVPIVDLHLDGRVILAAKLATAGPPLAMLAGSGIPEAERRVKDPTIGRRYAVDPGEGGEAGCDLSGFECRWRPIPARRGAITSLLVQARAPAADAAADTYRDVLAAIDDILAGGDARPVAVDTLRLAGPGDRFQAEATVRTGAPSGPRHLAARLRAAALAGLGGSLLQLGVDALGLPGSCYREQVVERTDFRKFDDTLRMVLDLKHDERARLMRVLSSGHDEGRLFYGAHVSDAALMTCMIQRYDGDHLHFVDGADGGYALAAKQLKAQLRAAAAA